MKKEKEELEKEFKEMEELLKLRGKQIQLQPKANHYRKKLDK